jgi:hypothetical protein
MPLYVQRPIDVARVTVPLQLDRDNLEVFGEHRQQSGKATLDRAHRAVQQHERRAAAMALVIQVETADIDESRGHFFGR